MNFKSLVAASLLSVVSVSSFAADQLLDLSSGYASFIGTGPLLSGGNDVLTFANLDIGTYDFDFTLSSQYASITAVTVNGELANATSMGNFAFYGLSSTTSSPFTVEISGTVNNRSLYSGELQVTPSRSVPEPSTYLLMLAALAMCLGVRRLQPLQSKR